MYSLLIDDWNSLKMNCSSVKIDDNAFSDDSQTIIFIGSTYFTYSQIEKLLKLEILNKEPQRCVS